MKKKFKYIGIILISIGVYIASINIWAWYEFRNIITRIESQSELSINLMEFTKAHREVDVVDPATVKEICEGISELKYGGIFSGVEAIYPPYDGDAYSLIVYSKEIHETFTLVESPQKTRVKINGKVSVSLKNYDNLYKSIQSVFEEE